MPMGLDVFALGANNQLFHKHQSTPGNSNWSNWEPVGTSTGWPLRRRPAVALNPDGTLEAFMLDTTGTLYHSWQSKQFPTFQNWVQFPTTQWTRWPVTSNPALGRNLDARLLLFLTASDGHTYHRWQTSSVDSWNNWASIWTELKPK